MFQQQLLNTNFAPLNLKIALAGSNLDNEVWNLVYDEECNGLQGLEVFTEITTAEYLEYVRKHGEAAQAIPTMNLFTIKPNMEGSPTQAKSRIVALGNCKDAARFLRNYEEMNYYFSLIQIGVPKMLLSPLRMRPEP